MTDKTPFTDLIATIEGYRAEREDMEKNILGEIGGVGLGADMDVLTNQVRLATSHRARKYAFKTALTEIRKQEKAWLAEQEPPKEAVEKIPAPATDIIHAEKKAEEERKKAQDESPVLLDAVAGMPTPQSAPVGTIMRLPRPQAATEFYVVREGNVLQRVPVRGARVSVRSKASPTPRSSTFYGIVGLRLLMIRHESTYLTETVAYDPTEVSW